MLVIYLKVVCIFFFLLLNQTLFSMIGKLTQEELAVQQYLMECDKLHLSWHTQHGGSDLLVCRLPQPLCCCLCIFFSLLWVLPSSLESHPYPLTEGVSQAWGVHPSHGGVVRNSTAHQRGLCSKEETSLFSSQKLKILHCFPTAMKENLDVPGELCVCLGFGLLGSKDPSHRI